MTQHQKQRDRPKTGEANCLNRRQVIQGGLGGMAALVVGRAIPGILDNPAYAAAPVQSLSFRITDAVKEMVTHNAVNAATCYFWLYKEDRFPAEVPGLNIFTTRGETIQITIANDLDEPHAFFIPGMFDSGSIAPGQTVTRTFVASRTGTFLYYDNLNPPVNRVMGLHGAFIVVPATALSGHRFTPYYPPTPPVQRLFDDLGASVQFPGLAWEQGDPANHTPPFRQHIWLLHEASPVLFEEVGRLPPGQIFDAAVFVDRFRNDPFLATGTNGIQAFNRKPHFFTIAGQSGHFAHHNLAVSPHYRVGEPAVVRILNAGLWTHSPHIHANHVYVLAVNGTVLRNLLFLDTFAVNPLETVDWLVPFIRPPEVPNERGIGLADRPLISKAGFPVWPPNEELALFFPGKGTVVGDVDISVQMSPQCFPMHDHIETSQTSQGGNYTLGMIAGVVFTGDRNVNAPNVVTFPNGEEASSPNVTGPAAPETHA
jgi:hypothetical protein